MTDANTIQHNADILVCRRCNKPTRQDRATCLLYNPPFVAQWECDECFDNTLPKNAPPAKGGNNAIADNYAETRDGKKPVNGEC